MWLNPSPETVARKQSMVLIFSDEGGSDMDAETARARFFANGGYCRERLS